MGAERTMSKRIEHDDDLELSDGATTLPSDFAAATRTTGTVDDNDDPADEREDENEAPIREKSENIEALQEFKTDENDIERAP
jgi:hypothetical protein